MDKESKNTVKKIVEDANRAASQIKKIQEGFKVPKIPDFNFPTLRAFNIQEFKLPEIPTQEEINDYQSAAVFMKAIAEEALSWKEQLPDEFDPAVIAVLYGGIQIQVQSLSQVSFHGIRIEGKLNDGPCSILAHQATVQILCFGAIKEETRRPIGFHWGDTSVEV